MIRLDSLFYKISRVKCTQSNQSTMQHNYSTLAKICCTSCDTELIELDLDNWNIISFMLLQTYPLQNTCYKHTYMSYHIFFLFHIRTVPDNAKANTKKIINTQSGHTSFYQNFLTEKELHMLACFFLPMFFPHFSQQKTNAAD